MTKRTESLTCYLMNKVSTIVLTLGLSVATAGSATLAYAAGDGIEASTVTTVRGKVLFEKRNTVVPYGGDLFHAISELLPFCDSMNNCPRSSPYWAMLVDDGQRQYELHQPFAMGSSRAPESVQIGGVVLHQGNQVSVEGSIETISDSYGIISEVKSISILSNATLGTQNYLQSIYGAEGTGWTCVSSDNPSYGVDAYIWYGRQNRTENENFHLRVIAKRLNDLAHLQQGVTEIGNVRMRQVAGNIVYEGEIDDTAATLAIRRDSPQIRNYPSSLSVSTLQGSLGVRMLCNPIEIAAPTSY
jgi:hypothetical protein